MCYKFQFHSVFFLFQIPLNILSFFRGPLRLTNFWASCGPSPFGRRQNGQSSKFKFSAPLLFLSSDFAFYLFSSWQSLKGRKSVFFFLGPNHDKIWRSPGSILQARAISCWYFCFGHDGRLFLCQQLPSTWLCHFQRELLRQSHSYTFFHLGFYLFRFRLPRWVLICKLLVGFYWAKMRDLCSSAGSLRKQLNFLNSLFSIPNRSKCFLSIAHK